MYGSKGEFWVPNVTSWGQWLNRKCYENKSCLALTIPPSPSERCLVSRWLSLIHVAVLSSTYRPHSFGEKLWLLMKQFYRLTPTYRHIYFSKTGFTPADADQAWRVDRDVERQPGRVCGGLKRVPSFWKTSHRVAQDGCCHVGLDFWG